MRKTVITLIAALGIAGSAIARDAPTDGARHLTDRQAKALAKALDGKAPGKPTSCVSRLLGTDGLTPIGDGILLYRVNSDLTYRNDLNGECTGISRGSTLVLEPTNDEYCRGDIAHVADLSIGLRGPSCALGDFVPYRTVGK